MEYNIGPETMIRDKQGNPVVMQYDLASLINKTEDTSFAHQHNYAAAATGVCFTRDYQGVLASLMENLYAGRKSVKREMLHIKNEHEKVLLELKNRGIEV